MFRAAILPFMMCLLMLPSPGGAADLGSLEARYESRRAALDQLWLEHDNAVDRFNAADLALDQELADIRRRQNALDARKATYLGAVERCRDAGCVTALNSQRDTINAEQIALNRGVDRYNTKLAERDADSAHLDLIEAQIGELEQELRTVEAALGRNR